MKTVLLEKFFISQWKLFLFWMSELSHCLHIWWLLLFQMWFVFWLWELRWTKSLLFFCQIKDTYSSYVFELVKCRLGELMKLTCELCKDINLLYKFDKNLTLWNKDYEHKSKTIYLKLKHIFKNCNIYLKSERFHKSKFTLSSYFDNVNFDLWKPSGFKYILELLNIYLIFK